MVLGLVGSSPASPTRERIAGLLVFSVLFNLASIRLITPGSPAWLLRARMLVNLTVNVLLVYMLGAYWEPAWLLLPLTPVAMAAYGTRAQTWAAALTASGLLLALAAAHGASSPVEWTQAVGRVLFTILVSLLVNALSRCNDCCPSCSASGAK